MIKVRETLQETLRTPVLRPRHLLKTTKYTAPHELSPRPDVSPSRADCTFENSSSGTETTPETSSRRAANTPGYSSARAVTNTSSAPQELRDQHEFSSSRAVNTPENSLPTQTPSSTATQEPTTGLGARFTTIIHAIALAQERLVLSQHGNTFRCLCSVAPFHSSSSDHKPTSCRVRDRKEQYCKCWCNVLHECTYAASVLLLTDK